ncbi:MAG: FixH family protein [Polaromonas sp.]|nr:FixH family protein [Polaromonas sp.]
MYRTLARLLGIAALASPLLACSTPPADLDLSQTHASVGKKFVVSLEPPATPAAINQIHSWKIRLHSPAGLPIAHAHIGVDGGMPQHGHGLPTQPQVKQELGDGVYLLEGMKFSMTGWWEIKLAIQTPEASDTVTFNTVVAAPGAVR